MSEEQIAEIEKLSKKNESVKTLYEQYKIFSLSPYADSYLTLFEQIQDLNKQLKIIPDEIRKRVVGNDTEGNVITVDWMPGKIDLFQDKDVKDFERAIKYFSEITKLHETLDFLRNKMLPQEKEVVDEQLASKKNNKQIAV